MKEFDEVVAVMQRLLAPDGCPWDREQTLETLRTYLLEETYEVLEAIDERDPHHHAEELGDLLFQIVFQSALRERDGAFTVADVCRAITEKLTRRHPHVFGDVKVADADEAYRNWERLKATEKSRKGVGGVRRSALDGVPPALPALLAALRVQEKVSRVGFDWPDGRGAIEKLEEEIREFAEERVSGDARRAEEELGDLLFALVNVARREALNPENALRGAVGRFSKRFRYIEEELERAGQRCEEKSLVDLDLLWERAKERERA